MYCSQKIPEYAPEMKEAACKTEDMKDTVAVPFLCSDAVQHGTDGVHHTTQNQKQQTCTAHCAQQIRNPDQDRPAADQVTDNSGKLKAFQIHSSQNDAEDRKKADNAEKHPAKDSANTDQGNRNVSAENQQKDIAMINNAENLLSFQPGRECVIDTGDSIKDMIIHVISAWAVM